MNKKQILVAAIHYPVASGRYIARALTRLGHDVKTVGPNTGNEIWGIEVDKQYQWTQDISEMDLRGAIQDWRPEIVIVAESSPFIDIEPALTLRDVPVVVYGVDNHVRDYAHLSADHYFFAHHDGPARPVRAANEHWLPCAYDPEYFYREPGANNRALLAGMVGVPYQRRHEVMSALARVAPNVDARIGMLYHEYREFYNSTLVSVCVSAAGDAAQRIFETAAMGCILLTDRCADFERLGLVEDEHYLGFETPDEAAAQVKGLLDKSDEEIAAMGERAYQWAKPHTWDARCEELLKVVFPDEA